MVIDIGEQDFQTEVVERSKQVPVVVDFWAEWCGPCRALSPALEAEANAREGEVVLAKVDTDANPNLGRAFDIRGIPAVKAFKDGEVVSEFVGAQPPAAVKRFFDELVPSEADRLVETGDEASLRSALDLEPGRADAALALARILQDRGAAEAAAELVRNLPGFAAEGLASRLRLEEAGDPDLSEAFAALDAGDTERALELLQESLTADGDARDDIRRVMVGVFDELGPAHPLAREFRRRLASALY